MKRIRVLLITVAVLAALTIAAYFLVFRDDVPEQVAGEETPPAASVGEESEEAYSPVQLVEMNQADTVRSLRVTRGEAAFTLRINEGEAEGESMRVVIEEYPGIAIPGETFSSLLFALMLASATETVAEGTADLVQFGLAEPEARCTITTDTTEQTLLLGSRNPSGTARYVMREGERAVYLVQSYFTDMLFPTLYALRKKQFDPVDLQQFDSLQVEQQGSTHYVVQRYRSDDPFDPGLFPFYFTAPFDPPNFFELLAPLQEGLTVAEFIDDPGELSEYGLDDATAVSVTIGTADGGSRKLLLGDETGDGLRYLLEAGTASPVMLLPAEAFRFIGISPFAYVESFVALVGIDTVSGFDLVIEDRILNAEILRSGEGDDTTEIYLANGIEVTEDAFKDFYQVIIGRQIEGEADPEVVQASIDAAPVLTLTYYHADDPDLKKVVELYPYNGEFLVVSIGGGKRNFLVGRYQAQYIAEQAELLLGGSGTP